jgi:hypothetical protein
VINLKQKIIDELERRGMTQTELAHKIGYTSISKFLKNEKTSVKEKHKEMSNFDALIGMLEILFPDTRHQIIEEYCSALNINNQSARSVLEYAINNRLENMYDLQILRLESTSKAASNKCAVLYRLEREVKLCNYDPHEMIERIQAVSVVTKDMQIFKRLLQAYVSYYFDMYDSLYKYVKDIDENINDITEEYIKKSYTVRVSRIMTACYLHKYQFEDARKYAHIAIQHTDNKIILPAIYHQLGHTYMYESYEKAYEYMTIAKEMYMKYRYDDVIQIDRSILFLQILWDVEPDKLPVSKDLSDVLGNLFYYIKQNNNEQVEKILSTIKEDDMNVFQKGFYCYYQGLKYKQRDLFIKSIGYFMETGDRFYRQLGLIELKKLGESEVLLNTLNI